QGRRRCSPPPRWGAATRSLTGGATASGGRPGSRRGSGPASCGGSPPRTWRRPSRTPPCSRSGPRRTRAWTSSPTARSAARATPTGSPPRRTASTSTTPAPPSTRAGTPTPCPRSSNPVPRIVGPIRRRHPVQVDDLKFLRAHTGRTVKVTVPGPFTMTQQAQNDYYPSREAAAFGYAEAVNEEIGDLFAAGADIVQLDEPYMQARPDEAREYGGPVLNRALDGVTGTTAVHICFGYAAIIHGRPAGYSFLPELAASRADQISIETAQSGLDCSVLEALEGKTIILGVLDLNDHAVESPGQVAERARKALPYVRAERLVLAPDCGMKYLPREAADGKLAAMTEAAARLRTELTS